MKKIIAATLMILGISLNLHAQNKKIAVHNHTSCDAYVTLWAWTDLTNTATSDNTSVIVVSAGTTYGPVLISNLPWRGGAGATVCGWQVGIGTTEDLTCGTGGTGTISFTNGGSGGQFHTTCTTNPSCPSNTLIQVSAGCGTVFSTPQGITTPFCFPAPTPPGYCPCWNGVTDQGEWDMEFDVTY